MHDSGRAARRGVVPWARAIALLAGWLALIGAAHAQEPPSLPPLPTPEIVSEVDPVVRETELSRGIIDFQRGNYDEALRRFDTAGGALAGSGASYFRGLSLLALERAREALGEFERVRKRSNAPREIDLDLGVAQLESGDAASAVDALDRYVQAEPDDPYGHYFLGVALFRQKKYQQALGELQRATNDAALVPYLDFYTKLVESAGEGEGPSPLAAAGAATGGGEAAQFARQLNGLPNSMPAGAATQNGMGRPGDPALDPDRKWNLALITGYEYDTNVSLAPAITPIGLGALNKIDSRWLIASFGDYRIVQRDEWVLGVIAATYDSFQFRLEQFNVQDYMGGTYTNVALGQFIAGVRYQFHETLLNGNQFSTDHRLTPNLTLREGTFGHLTTYYEFESIDITGFALIPAQIRSGNIDSVGVTQAFYLFNGAGRLFLEYRYDRANTIGSDFDRRTNQADARLEIPLPWEIVGNVEARYFWDDYLNPNSLDFFNRPRRDRRIEARVGLQKFFTPKISGRLEYIYTHNDSNIENLFGASFYTYNRHILSALLIYDF